MSTSEISNEKIILASFDDVPEEVRKAFEERMKAREEKEMHELLACYMNDRRDSITQIKEPILPPIDSTKEIHNEGTVSIYHYDPEVVSAMFVEHVKLTRNMVGDEVAKGLAKFSQNSKYQPTPFATTHPTTPSPSATASTSVTQPPYGMLLNYFSGQTPSSHKTAMTLYMSKPIPISSIPPTSAILGQASIMTPIVPTGAGSNTATRVRHAAPHAAPTGHLNKTTTRIWEGVKARLRDMGISPISHKIYQNLYPSIFDSVAYPTGWHVLDFIKFDGEGSRTTWAHVRQYLAQLGEASSIEALRVRLFSLSLIVTAFVWFSSLPAHSIYGWESVTSYFFKKKYNSINLCI
jgi:hypothetical protein